MATIDVSNRPSKGDKEFFFETLSRKEDIHRYVGNVIVVLKLRNKEVAESVFNTGCKFLIKSTKSLLGQRNNHCKVELHDALKHRSDEFIQLATKLIEDIGNEEELELRVGKNKGAVCIYHEPDKRIIWHRHNFYPNFCYILLDGIVEVLNMTRDPILVRESLRCILSFSMVYKDLRGSSDYTLEQELEALDRLSSTKYTTNEEFESKLLIPGTLENLFYKFINGLANPALFKGDELFQSLTMQFRNTLTRYSYKFKSKYKTYDKRRDSNFSFKSSGTTVKINKRSRTVPAMIASAFEPDNLKNRPKVIQFDEILGFEETYGYLSSKNVKFKYRPTISIPQKKLARRVIHPGDNARQDRLGYFHNLISDFLRMYNPDCTFNQRKGIEFCKQFSKYSSYAFYCMDQTKATDTMLISAQKLVLTILLCQIHEAHHAVALADAWADMVSGEDNTFYLSNGKTKQYHMKVGQPQGYLSSFVAFSLLNHVAMLFSLYLYYKEKHYSKVIANKSYVLVGDDSAVKLQDNDPEGRFQQIYILVNRMLNVEVNPEKGFSNFGERTSTTAEFAKVLSINGEYFTPTPFNIASNSANISAENFLKYLLWVHEKTGYTFTESNIHSLINERFSLTTEQRVGLDLILNVNAENNEFYNLIVHDSVTSVDKDATYRLLWFNFINLVSKSVCKYTLSYKQNEEVVGVCTPGLASEEMFKEVKFFKHLDDIFDVTMIPRESKLYIEYSWDFAKQELFPYLNEYATEDLLSIANESNLLCDCILEMLEQDLTTIGKSVEEILDIVSYGPDFYSDENVKLIREITPLLGQRSWSLSNYHIDSNYLETIGHKLGNYYLNYANDKYGTDFDVEPNLEELSAPVSIDDLDFDLGLEFEF